MEEITANLWLEGIEEDEEEDDFLDDLDLFENSTT
jgi:hypothetical protein